MSNGKPHRIKRKSRELTQISAFQTYFVRDYFLISFNSFLRYSSDCDLQIVAVLMAQETGHAHAFKSLIKFGASTFWGLQKLIQFSIMARRVVTDCYTPRDSRGENGGGEPNLTRFSGPFNNNTARIKMDFFVIYSTGFLPPLLSFRYSIGPSPEPVGRGFGANFCTKLEMILFVAISCVHC